jgi:hypothetical protein
LAQQFDEDPGSGEGGGVDALSVTDTSFEVDASFDVDAFFNHAYFLELEKNLFLGFLFTGTTTVFFFAFSFSISLL